MRDSARFRETPPPRVPRYQQGDPIVLLVLLLMLTMGFFAAIVEAVIWLQK